jgi:serine/threonine protein kinase
MVLELGSRLGNYEILEPLGAGGMGEVYRARDTKLGREVAIKVLSAEFSQDKERLERFEREAKLLAALNHPNIATLYGFEEHDGQKFLVMELVEGITLAERIAEGPVPLEEAIPLALQIADGLEAAHEKGIVHRDLKPANIKITADGNIKILDFGLAKAFAEDASQPEPATSMSPTLTRGATRVGVILGTAAYMSPEQAKGKPVDKRADIFAFGAVLFEMLTGKKAFPGESASDVLAAVIKSEPNWSDLPSTLAPRQRELVRRCVEKDPRQRFRDIGAQCAS